MGEKAWLAGKLVCGSGQHLPARATGQRGGTDRRERAANAIRPRDGAARGGVDSRQLSASQRTGGARNGLLQDRLVKELRLAGINDLDSANEFLKKTFLPALNARFRFEPRSRVNAHRKCRLNLQEILCWEETRVVGKDWTVAWKGRWFQIDAEHERLLTPA